MQQTPKQRFSDSSETYLTKRNVIKGVALVILNAFLIFLLKFQSYFFDLTPNVISIQFIALASGKYICIIFFYLRLMYSPVAFRRHFRKYKKENVRQGKLYDFSIFYLFPSSILYTFENLFILYCICYWPPSFVLIVFQTHYLFSLVLKKVAFGKNLKKHEIFGFVILLISTLLIILSIFINLTINDVSENQLKIFYTIFVAVFLRSLRVVYEKWFKRDYASSEFRLSGLEGVFSIIIFSAIQVGFWIFNITKFNIIIEAMQLFQKTDNIWFFLSFFVIGAFLELMRSSIGKKINGRSIGAEFVVFTTMVAIELKVDYFDLKSEDFDVWKLISILRYVPALLFFFGCLIVHESIEIRLWNLNSEMEKYEIKNFEDEQIPIEEEFSIMKQEKNK